MAWKETILEYLPNDRKAIDRWQFNRFIFFVDGYRWVKSYSGYIVG
jgi:hypothetical protein